MLIDGSDSISYCVTDKSRTYMYSKWNARPFLGIKKKRTIFTSLESRASMLEKQNVVLIVVVTFPPRKWHPGDVVVVTVAN